MFRIRIIPEVIKNIKKIYYNINIMFKFKNSK